METGTTGVVDWRKQSGGTVHPVSAYLKRRRDVIGNISGVGLMKLLESHEDQVKRGRTANVETLETSRERQEHLEKKGCREEMMDDED